MRAVDTKFISVKEAAEIMGVCRATIRNWFKLGLQKTKVGNQYRIELHHFLNFVDSNELCVRKEKK